MSSRQDSELTRLRQLLREADERTEQERQRAEQERQRAEQERQRAEQEGKKIRATTFEEYLSSCHKFISKPLQLQTDRRFSTQGSITSPKNKLCPNLLKPWVGFPARQQQLFERIYEYISPEAELFNSVQYLRELGQDLCDRPLASEKDLEIYLRLAVERPTTNIISHLQRIEGARRAFNLGKGIIYEYHANTLSDSNEEVQQSLENLRNSSRQQSSSSNVKPQNLDQICVYKEADGGRKLCMLVEYKPPHKLSNFNLRAGLLRADSQPLNLLEDVINRVTIPTDPEAKFVYHSEWLVAAALVQTYSYMIENGLEYSKLATGEADVYLRIEENDPHTLYYHLAEPSIEAEAHSDVDIDILLCRTAVAQNLTLCLMALDSKPRSQKWRDNALDNARRVTIDHEAILRQMSPGKKVLTPPSSAYHARIYHFTRSPIMLRPRKRKVRSSCGSTDINVEPDPRSPSGSSDETSDIETPSKIQTRARQSGAAQTRSTKSSQSAEKSHGQDRRYCTQGCLLGLVRNSPLDDACPNADAHRASEVGNQHALGKKSLMKLMSRQLYEDPDNGCEPLGKQGSRGALFRLTLESYGYTFVAKGTVAAFVPMLEHEGSVYRHLEKVQGDLIPVYLGNISLVRPYFLDVGVRIVHMLLMSWAGEEAREDSLLAIGRDLAMETNGAVAEMQRHRVTHHDIRPPNVLWNPETSSVMLIDFERSEIMKPLSILQEISPNGKLTESPPY